MGGINMQELMLRDILEVSEDKSFEYSGGTINISKMNVALCMITRKYKKKSETCIEEFLKRWMAYDTVYELKIKVEDDLCEGMAFMLEQVKNDLISVGMFDVNMDDLVSMVGVLKFDEAYNIFKQKFDEDFNILESYDPNEKDRVQYLNPSLGRAVATFAIDFLTYVEKDMSYLKEFHKRDCYIDELKEVLHQTYYFTYIILLTYIGYQDEMILDRIEREKLTVNLYNNLDNRLISREDKNKIVEKIFEINPFYKPIYAFQLRRNTKDKDVIYELAKIFYIDIDDIKNIAADNLVDNIYDVPNEMLLEARELLQDFCREIDMEYSEKCLSIKKLEKRILELEEKDRTVEGVVCSTIEAAKVSQNELPYINEYFNYVQKPHVDSLLDYEYYLYQLKNDFMYKFTSEIAGKYIKLLDEYEEEFNNNFINVNGIKCSNKKEAGFKRAINFANSLDVSNDYALQYSIQLLNNELYKFGIDETQAQEVYALLYANQNRKENQIVKPKGGFFKKNK